MMPKILFFLTILFNLFSGCSSKTFYDNLSSYDEIVGNWYFSDSTNRIDFKFFLNEKCQIIFFSANDTMKIEGKVEMDFTKSPVTISISKIPGLNFSLHSIIAKKSVNSIIISNFSKKWRLRPINFSEYDLITLKKREG
jgi:hypothetical protein